MGRIGTGAAVAALPLAVGIWTGSAGHSWWLTGSLFGLALLILVLSMAAYLPLLHGLPVVGAPRLRIKFQADGRSALRVGIRREPESPFAAEELPEGRVPKPALEARTVHLQVGVRVLAREDIDAATITFMHPEGLRHVECDASGRRRHEGTWMPPTSESLGGPVSERGMSDYWVRTIPLRGGGSHLLYFKLTFERPGEYPVRVKVSASAFYRDVIADAVISVDEIIRDAEDPVDRIAYVIAEGEELRTRMQETIVNPNPHTHVAAFYLSVHGAIPMDRGDLTGVLNRSKADHDGPQTGPEYLGALLDATLEAAYDIRRRVARDAT